MVLQKEMAFHEPESPFNLLTCPRSEKCLIVFTKNKKKGQRELKIPIYVKKKKKIY